MKDENSSVLSHVSIGTNEGAPGLRPEYTEHYYGCFVRDPDGHKVEAMCWEEMQ